MPSRSNLKLASFDSGGIRGLSQLEIMNHIIHQLEWDKESNESGQHSRPCEYFDLIGGSGTGGLISILFAKLEMSVDEASEHFCDIVENVFQPKNISASQRTEALRRCMESILLKKGLPIDLPLAAKKPEGCASFVVASPLTNAKTAVCLRTYPVRRQPPSTITVVEAVLATCATQPEFVPVSSGARHKAREYIAASGAANPVHEVITEAHLLFGGDTTVISLLSVGTGHPGVISLPHGDGESSLYRIMRNMMHDCEQRAQEIEERIGRAGIYSRFSVEQGMQDDLIGQFNDLGWITVQTEDYLGRHEVGKKLDLLAQNLGTESGPVTLDQLKHTGGPSVLTPAVTVVQRPQEVLTPNRDDEVLAKLKPKDLERDPQVAVCLEGTRKDILDQIRGWAKDLGAPNILWISGYPGVGKSAIAATIVEEWRSSNRLGSSFLFQRERASVMTPNTLWRTVAYDLAQRYSGIREHLLTALNKNKNLPATSNVDALFHELIYEPLLNRDDIPTMELPIVVLDALDECGGNDGRHSDHRKSLMRTLKTWSSLPRIFKLVVTSRRESDIERLFSATVHHYIEIIAGEKTSSLSSSDIRTFLLHELRQLVAQYPSLASDWPGEEVINWLVGRAGGVFLWIKTIVKLLERGEPQRTLKQVLRTGAGGMAGLYTRILHTSFPAPGDKDLEDLKALLGAIIFTKEPLDAASLAHFLSIDSSTMEYICNGLQSVLDCGDIIRIHHQSFVDFLLDPNDCPASFLIDQGHESQNLALCCLKTMKVHLRFNICDLESSYVRNQDVENLDLRVYARISPSLSYSSRYWAVHLAEATSNNHLNDSLKYFMTHQFLFWLEVMSLIKHVNIASSMLQLLVTWMRKSNQEDSLATDMQKFLAAFASVISQSVPHLYISALPFSARDLSVSKQYLQYYPQTFKIRHGGYRNWPAIQNICSGHTNTVYSAVFSPDGRRIASGSRDYTIRVWDAGTGETVVGPLRGHNDVIRSVSFSPDGKRIVSGSDDDTIRLWDAETGEMTVRPLQGNGGTVWSVSFSPDGSRIVSGDDTIRVWDIETGKTVVGPFLGHNGAVFSVSFSADGRRIVSGSYDRTVRVWDAKTAEEVLGPLRGHSDVVWSVSFSPDGKRIASSSNDHTIRIRDAETGVELVKPIKVHKGPVWSVSFSPDGKKIVSGSYDHTIRVWDAETGQAAIGPLQGHRGDVNSVSFSSDGGRIVSSSSDHTIRVWDAETRVTTGGLFQGHGGMVRSVSFSPDGRRIVSGSDDDTICVWDAETGERVLGPLEGHVSVWSVSFSLDGKRIASGSYDNRIRVWDAETGETVLGPLAGHVGTVWSVCFSPDGRRIVSGSDDETIRIWDAETGAMVLGPLQGHSRSVWSVAYSPDGRRIVSGSDDHTIRVWDSKTGRMITRPFQSHSRSVWSVSFSPDGSQIVSGSGDNTIRVWDADTGETLLRLLRGHSGLVRSVSFSTDGTKIGSGSHDDTIRIWDVETGETIIGPLKGHDGDVNSISFSPDGSRVVSGSDDRTVRVWDASENVNAVETYSIFRYSANTRDGWVFGPNEELLLWVPPEIRPRLCPLSNILVIDKRQEWTALDVTHFVHGEEWARCKDPVT